MAGVGRMGCSGLAVVSHRGHGTGMLVVVTV